MRYLIGPLVAVLFVDLLWLRPPPQLEDRLDTCVYPSELVGTVRYEAGHLYVGKRLLVWQAPTTEEEHVALLEARATWWHRWVRK